VLAVAESILPLSLSAGVSGALSTCCDDLGGVRGLAGPAVGLAGG
jgi:hypothetical protein